MLSDSRNHDGVVTDSVREFADEVLLEDGAIGVLIEGERVVRSPAENRVDPRLVGRRGGTVKLLGMFRIELG